LVLFSYVYLFQDGIDITAGNIATKLREAVDYLNVNRNSQNKPYEQAILTYALALQNSPHRFSANQKLRQMSNMDHGELNIMWRNSLFGGSFWNFTVRMKHSTFVYLDQLRNQV
jgi:hypothetical protein